MKLPILHDVQVLIGRASHTLIALALFGGSLSLGTAGPALASSDSAPKNGSSYGGIMPPRGAGRAGERRDSRR